MLPLNCRRSPAGKAAIWAAYLFLALLIVFTPRATPLAETFQLPTPNRALFEPGKEEQFYAPTPGRTWESGSFGCVRSEGWQFHEGIDILATERDRRNEPLDRIVATATGTVVYINDKAGLSNYGKYIVIRHEIEGIPVFSTYAHLSQIREGLQSGDTVSAGDEIGVMGRTTNTRTPISKERAHLHFELNLMINERFPQWFRKTYKSDQNEHEQWNGMNLVGMDPASVLQLQQSQQTAFSLLNFLRSQKEQFRVIVRDTEFPWLKRYAPLVRRNPLAESEGAVAYEVAFNSHGLPFLLVPRAASELAGNSQYQVVFVDEEDYKINRCKRMIVKRGESWELTARGIRFLELLTF